MTSPQWARLDQPGADLLRRGAWYPVVRHAPSGELVLLVDRREVSIAAGLVRLRDKAPSCWSVVRRVGVLRPAWGGTPVTPLYAVCPRCRERQDFTERPETLRCSRCGNTAPVDWSEMCQEDGKTAGE